MLHFDAQRGLLIGPDDDHSLAVSPGDFVTCKLAMLIAGECLGLGPVDAAEAFGYSKQRYFQLRDAFALNGAAALLNR